MYLHDGQVVFLGNIMLNENEAHDGGAIYSSNSEVFMEMYSSTEISTNSVVNNGGGLYLTMSKLDVRGNNLYITKNQANKTGGGLHAANTSIIIEDVVRFTDNGAENGGGISLERNAKLYERFAGNGTALIYFASNRAKYHGGALYVNDETNPEICVATAMQNTTSTTECFLTSLFVNLLDNSAGISGSNLFGGLLDRCKLYTEFYQETESAESGLTNFQRLSNISESQLNTISSHPVPQNRMCFCRDNQPDCNYQPESIQVNRGRNFSINLIAYDQVYKAVNATIYCSLNSSVGGLGKNQAIQVLNGACTDLQFNLFSPLDSEDLILFMTGPCNVTGISERKVRIDITCTCPIGFQIFNKDKTVCDCVCHQVLQTFDKTECNSITESIIRKDNFWIAYANHTELSGYIIYPNCPFDYCYPPGKQVSINLNLPNGSDAQCASNRAGTLCGTCKPGLSVPLGSSRCLHCPTYWPGLLVTIFLVFILSGIGLVALILALNLTVAVGTLNAIIFYANIMAANQSAFFPTSEVSFASVLILISWLNFDLGIDTCFIDGMDTYIKTWLQLAFPVYIIFLVIVVIKT